MLLFRAGIVTRLMLVVSVVGLLLVVLAAGSGAASASEPWWHVSTISRPTNLPAKPEVQEVDVGLVTVLEVEGKFVACVGELGGSFCEEFTGHPYTATATELQTELEAASGISGVEVTEPSAATYKIQPPPGHFAPVLEIGEYEIPPAFQGSVKSSSELAGSVHGGSRLVVIVSNLGDAASEGGSSPVRITDVLPAGVAALHVEAPAGAKAEEGAASCTIERARTVSCSFAGTLPPYESIEMEIEVVATTLSEGREAGQVSVSGGGAASVSVQQPVVLSSKATGFGMESYSLTPEEEGGAPATQAGGHPFQLTTVVDLNQGPVSGPDHFQTEEEQPALPRNFRFYLPAGLVANASAVPQCSETQFAKVEDLVNECPAQAAIGAAAVTVIEHKDIGLTTLAVPVFNLAPAGEPARFGFTAAGVSVVLNTTLRAEENYGAKISVNDTSESAELLDSVVTLWGVPGDARHNSSRGLGCVYYLHPRPCVEKPEGLEANTFLRMPTSCGTPLSIPATLESWPITKEIGVEFPAATAQATATGVSLDGCNHVPFTPQLEVQPDQNAKSAASPAGITVHVKVPQQASAPSEGVDEADVRDTTVSLPAGLQVNSAAAAGLQACTTKEIGYLRRGGAGELVFSEETEAETSGEEAHKTGCPEASRIGSVQIISPLLKENLTGYVYQAAQNANPFGSLLAVYIIAEAPNVGVRVRLAGEVKVQPNGSLVSTFPQTPQLPFEEFTLKFFGGGKAPLATSTCGKYTTESMIEPWSSTIATPVLADPSSFFEVTSGPHGTPCASLGSFAPAFAAGTTNNDAGAFSPLTLTLTRKDGEQPLSTLSVTMPPGLAGMLSTVQLCPEPQASTGECPEASKIGHVRVTAGVGGEPVVLPEPGKPEDPIYLTGPYNGAPFGITVLAHAEAGPFNLGNVLVRGKIEINPLTSQVTIETNPAPTELQNIPLNIRTAEVFTDRPSFIFNPTNCQAMSITGTARSSQGASEPVSSRYQAADCATLPFKAGLQATTHAGHTRRNGAYLQVKLTSGHGQANIKSVHVELPKILPSRTETLKDACSETQFAKNPAGCPAGSRVGTAIAHTPVLPVPLQGPAIFVSHGGAAFPDLDLVLEGDGVTIKQTGTTNITKNITSSSFNSIPDVPLTSVEVTLPEGPHSALAATANLCTTTTTKRIKIHTHNKTIYTTHTTKHKRTLTMPTTITSQNGDTIKQNTKITVTGCHKH
jgi:hypothetical protein